VADLVANLCRRYGRRFPQRGNIHQLFRFGVYDVLDARMASLLRGVRALEVEDRSGAFQEIANVDLSNPFAKNSVAILMLKRLAKAIHEDLTGEDVALLAHESMLSKTPSAPAAPEPTEIGTVVRFYPKDGFGVIRAEASSMNYRFHVSAWKSATYPSDGETVEFIVSRTNDQSHSASWVRALA
jgi:cold shock CspA family protein